MQPLISVIVPIYKVEKYLNKCVDSIINQTYKKLEIILVDDGSPDGCGKICDDYAEKDIRIKVIHKKNGGLSDARNAGMKIATGEYISFIDSDDWIDVKAYENMMKVAVENNADIVECNVNYDYDGRIEEYNRDEYAVYTDNNSIMEAYIKYYHIKTVAWNKLYKRCILDGIEFEFGKYNEDEFFTYKVLSKATRFVHLSDYYYFYYQRNTSIMGTYNIKRLDMMDALKERLDFIEENYPDLLENERVTFSNVCLYHYQMLLKNKHIEGNKIGRVKVQRFRKKVIIHLPDVKNMDLINKLSLLCSNNKLGLYLVCLIRNTLRFGL